MKNSKKKLALKKKTVFNLNDKELNTVKGGRFMPDTRLQCQGSLLAC